jgi:hypothetical protein
VTPVGTDVPEKHKKINELEITLIVTVLTRVTLHHSPEDSILHSHRRENLKSYSILLSHRHEKLRPYIALTGWLCSGEMCLL